MISFWLPPELQLVNKDKCEIPLQGTKPITLQLKATCPATGATEGLKAIIPHISNYHSLNYWDPRADLPTIWVCKPYIVDPRVSAYYFKQQQQ